MASGELASKTIHELQALLCQQTVSPSEILEDLLARIERFNPSLHTYLSLDPERLRRQLSDVSKRPGALAGIPITIKDNICMTGEETSCASRILQGFRPPYDAPEVAQ